LAPQGIKPSLEVAFADHNMPFVELARTHQTIHTTGVVKITNVSMPLRPAERRSS
jgi:hypothetical protein